MADLTEQYRLMSISEASRKFNICREELVKCIHRGLKYQRVGTRKKLCLKWWIDYLESEDEIKHYETKKRNNGGVFKMDKATKENIYTL